MFFLEIRLLQPACILIRKQEAGESVSRLVLRRVNLGFGHILPPLLGWSIRRALGLSSCGRDGRAYLIDPPQFLATSEFFFLRRGPDFTCPISHFKKADDTTLPDFCRPLCSAAALSAVAVVFAVAPVAALVEAALVLAAGPVVEEVSEE